MDCDGWFLASCGLHDVRRERVNNLLSSCGDQQIGGGFCFIRSGCFYCLLLLSRGAVGVALSG